jgi:NADH:ubiquinone oxidoreductase subunit 4 (subunit M)
MIFFGAFKNGWEMGHFHIFQIATVLALWGVVISTVYMLRAYRKTFMGSLSERWKGVVDLRPALRIPVALVVMGLLCYGFFPQSFVQTVTPVLHTYVTTDRHRIDLDYCSHGAVRRSRVVSKDEENASQGRSYNIGEVTVR